ncbi:Imm1 family immunity protein [Amycolatopsis sp. cg5]|uniref:Imm1 family immunity protein n=1 Tax=Amycolatopsis sp. cg5 TaxID=3238802 RepID=UPI0035254E7E
MVAVTAYFTREAETLNNPADADALLTRMEAAQGSGELPRMAELGLTSSTPWGVLEVGINGERGFVTHISPSGSVISSNGTDSPEMVEYDHQEHVRDVPASAEIPVGQVREAVRQFVESGGSRPDNIAWTEV